MCPAPTRLRFSLVAALAGSLFLGSLLPVGGFAQDPDTSTAPLPGPPSAPASPDTSVGADVPFVVSPQTTVEGMLELANVSEDDVVYDLGSGDGRIPVTAAEEYGARAVGIEIQPDLVQRARKNAELSGVRDRVEFRQQDLFEANFSDATVVTLYLFPKVNIKLRPMLFEQLEPGTRVVSHSFDMDEWEPDTSVTVNGDILYLWTIPEDPPSFGREK